MKVLVTGATGFVGSHAVQELLEAGHTVRALVRPTSDASELTQQGIELALGSLADEAVLEAALDGCRGVVHAAGIVKATCEAELLDVNGSGTGRLVRAARSAPGVERFVYVSSIAAAGPGGGQLAGAAGGRPAEPVSMYGRSKLIGEERTLEAADSLHVTIIRPPLVYGPRDRALLKLFQLAKRRMLPVPAVPARVSAVHAADLARALRLSLEGDHPSGRVFSLEDGVPLSWHEIGRVVADALGVRPATFRVPLWFVALAARASVSYSQMRRRARKPRRGAAIFEEVREPLWTCDSSAIRADLGWEASCTFAQAAPELAAWYKAAGWL